MRASELVSSGIDLYRPFTNPVTRETFRCISFDEEAFTMEWIVHPGGYVPFEHVHILQDEVFHVQKGEMRARINKRETIGKEGDTVVIPRGTRHIAFNDQVEDLVCIVEYKPGLDHFKTMQCFAGLTIDCDYNRRGLVNIAKILYLLKKSKAQSLTRPAYAPEFLFRFGMDIFFLIGSMLGWRSLYKKYTGLEVGP
jgi:quercetin dioxygenase-like cupin family protein